MSKPLELTIYPPLSEEPNPVRDGWDAWHEWDSRFTKEINIRRTQHLTEAELAAEYWRAEWTTQYDANRDPSGEQYELGETVKTQALHRFATSPHYFEAP